MNEYGSERKRDKSGKTIFWYIMFPEMGKGCRRSSCGLAGVGSGGRGRDQGLSLGRF